MITAFGGPEGYLSLPIIAFEAYQFIVPKYYYRLGKWNLRSRASLFKGVTVFKDLDLFQSLALPPSPFFSLSLPLPSSPSPSLSVLEKKTRQKGSLFSAKEAPRFRKRVGGRGLATKRPPKRAPKVLQKSVPILLRGHRKKGTEKGPESLAFEGFLRANPLCPPTPFRNFWLETLKPRGPKDWEKTKETQNTADSPLNLRFRCPPRPPKAPEELR